MKTVFLRVLEAEDKETALLATIQEPAVARGKRRFDVNSESFASVPRSPFVYWVSERLRRLFKELPPFEAEGRIAKQGLATADDFRFVRAWWAVPVLYEGERWFPFAKGGKFSPFYSDVFLVVNWARSGEEIKNNLNERGGVRSNVWMLRDTVANFFLRPGLTWPARPHRRGAFANIPPGCIFSHTGTMLFCPSENHWALCAVLNSDAYIGLLHTLMPRGGSNSGQTLKYEVGYVVSVPIPHLTAHSISELTNLARRAWSLRRLLASHVEISHAYLLPTFIQSIGSGLSNRATAWSEYTNKVEAELIAIQSEIDEYCFKLYGIDMADRRAITGGFGASAAATEPDDDAATDIDGDTDDENEAESIADSTSFTAELVSWAVGVVFGRFDIRLATGARSFPPQPDPFDPLPVCSPGMLTGDDGLPLANPPADYPISFPESGILVDDPGHAQDITAAVRAVFDVVFGADAHRWWNDIAALLDPKDHELRTWLASNFFDYHIKRYSKSRRKAPILWQLSTPSGRYSVWLYAHRVTRDSLFQLQNEFVGPKLAHEERLLANLVQSAGGSPSARERKEIAAQESFIEELRTMLDEVKRVAPLWNPNLDDGVVLVMAPLWRLVPQHKAWQKELRSRWDELVAGKYDWAHIAMYLWPERVVPKCAADRSLAIAHGLEDVFWEEGDDGKWNRRPEPTRPIDELVSERTSPAVKESLKSLLEALVPGGTSQRKRKGDRS